MRTRAAAIRRRRRGFRARTGRGLRTPERVSLSHPLLLEERTIEFGVDRRRSWRVEILDPEVAVLLGLRCSG